MENNKFSNKLRSGFSLIDVLLYTLVIMAIGVVLISASGTLSTGFSSSLESTATTIASCEVERLRKLDFLSLPGNGEVDSSCRQNNMAAFPGTYPTTKSANRTVSDYLSDSDIKQIVVTVSWPENGITKDAKVETLIAKYGT